MLRNTFLMLDGIGYWRESKLWGMGILTWEDFINETRIPGISRWKKAQYDRELELADFQLRNGISHYFASRLAERKHWRLFEDFKKEACYLDVETSGLDGCGLTVVGVSDGRGYRCFIRGINLTSESLQRELSKSRLLITFYGSAFDLPLLKRSFPSLTLLSTLPHFDLYFAARRLGLGGGLKRLEEVLGIGRDPEIEGMTGADAVRLWAEWVRDGNEESLGRLIAYNRADVLNLIPLAERFYKELKRMVFLKKLERGRLRLRRSTYRSPRR
jgi:uncharacterized protein YprB with RNaseH-like and TPR domain